MSAIAVGLTALAAATAADVGAIVASLSLIVTGIADLIPVVIGKIGEGIVEFGKAIALGAPSLGEAASRGRCVDRLEHFPRFQSQSVHVLALRKGESM